MNDKFTKYNTDGYTANQIDELNRRATLVLSVIDLDDTDTDTEVKHIYEKIVTTYDNELAIVSEFIGLHTLEIQDSYAFNEDVDNVYPNLIGGLYGNVTIDYDTGEHEVEIGCLDSATGKPVPFTWNERAGKLEKD